MQRILLSLAVLAAVGGATIASTGAFFSDTETSTGNTFTAGAIDLKVDAQAHYDGLICTGGVWADDPAIQATTSRPELVGQPCIGTWTLTDLGPTNQFFNLSDVKPGDQGENTISLHVDNNPAYACADVSITENSDQTCLTPENAAVGGESGACVPEGAGGTHGDLAQNLNFFAWADNGKNAQGATVGVAGDNIWQAGEVPLFSNNIGPASDVLGGKSYTLANPVIGALPGGSTSYIGLAWCAGSMTAVAGVITCNGATMDNKAQTDSMKANITFRVEQARNNPNFTCTPQVAPQTGSLTVTKIVVPLAGPAFTADDNVVAGDFSMNVKDGSAVDVAGSPHAGSAAGFTFTNIAPGSYTVGESGPITFPGEHVVATYSGDCNGVNTVTIAAGQTKSCTVTNTYTADQS